MSSQLSNTNSGAPDLKNVGVLEKFMYQVPAGTFFIKETTRFAPFAKYDKEITATRRGVASYASTFEVDLPSEGDYLLHTYAEVELSDVALSAANKYGENGRIGYVSNIGHHLFKSISLMINDVAVATLDGRFLDSNFEFMSEGPKYLMYQRAIGNDLRFNPTNTARPKALPAVRVMIPLPFFFSRDSGSALPLATLINCTKYIKFEMRNWDEILMLESTNMSTCSVMTPTAADLAAVPTVKSFKLKCDYANVTKYELSKIGCMTRPMMIEQPRSYPIVPLDEKVGAKKVIEFEPPVGAIKTMYFSVVNTTHPNIHHNYRVGCPVGHSVARLPEGSVGPAIATARILHGKDERVPENSYEFFSMMQPLWYGTRGPTLDNGLCMYSYALKPNDMTPAGTSNPGAKDQKIKFEIAPTVHMDEAHAAHGAGHKETFGFSLVTVSYRLARVRHGKFDMLSADGKFRKDLRPDH